MTTQNDQRAAFGHALLAFADAQAGNVFRAGDGTDEEFVIHAISVSHQPALRRLTHLLRAQGIECGLVEQGSVLRVATQQDPATVATFIEGVSADPVVRLQQAFARNVEHVDTLPPERQRVYLESCVRMMNEKATQLGITLGRTNLDSVLQRREQGGGDRTKG